jgi:hypothetical protein
VERATHLRSLRVRARAEQPTGKLMDFHWDSRLEMLMD